MDLALIFTWKWMDQLYTAFMVVMVLKLLDILVEIV